MTKIHINEQLKTNFEAQGSRIAGTGIEEDDYSESSFPDDRPRHRQEPANQYIPIKVKTYPVKKYKLTDRELEHYRNLNI